MYQEPQSFADNPRYTQKIYPKMITFQMYINYIALVRNFDVDILKLLK